MAGIYYYGKTGAAPSLEGERTVRNRFGAVTVSPEKAIRLEGGLLGFLSETEYCLTDYPGRSDFKLLQSLRHDDLCFIVLPSATDNPLYRPEHVAALCLDLGIPKERALLLLLVSVYAEGDVRTVTCNAKAPILLDALLRRGAQRVLPYARYSVRHPV
jgi:flagellar assembly factor FliW